MQIFLCEDNLKYRESLEAAIKSHIIIEDYNMQLALSTGDPVELLNFIEELVDKRAFDVERNTHSLFFLDVDLQNEMDGITLASKIRKIEPSAKIVFITTHVELSALTFRYKIEALDYIEKGEVGEIFERIKENIDEAYEQHLRDRSPARGGFTVKSNRLVRFIAYDKILFFESLPSPHKVCLHTDSDLIEFYSSLNTIEETLNSDFFRSHKSFIVNINNIKYVNKAAREIEMCNGSIALVSPLKIKHLITAMGK